MMNSNLPKLKTLPLKRPVFIIRLSGWGRSKDFLRDGMDFECNQKVITKDHWSLVMYQGES